MKAALPSRKTLSRTLPLFKSQPATALMRFPFIAIITTMHVPAIPAPSLLYYRMSLSKSLLPISFIPSDWSTASKQGKLKPLPMNTKPFSMHTDLSQQSKKKGLIPFLVDQAFRMVGVYSVLNFQILWNIVVLLPFCSQV